MDEERLYPNPQKGHIAKGFLLSSAFMLCVLAVLSTYLMSERTKTVSSAALTAEEKFVEQINEKRDCPLKLGNNPDINLISTMTTSNAIEAKVSLPSNVVIGRVDSEDSEEFINESSLYSENFSVITVKFIQNENEQLLAAMLE